MNEYEVNCINKPDRFSSYEHITYIWNNLNNWRLTLQEAINLIDIWNDKFYVLTPDKSKKVYIWVVREIWKNPYLRTYADWYWNDNLLSLPECWLNCKIL